MRLPCCDEKYAKIPKDVPVFTLIGWDLLGMETIRWWLVMAKERGVNQEKIERGEAHLAAFAKFQNEYPDLMKLPD